MPATANAAPTPRSGEESLRLTGPFPTFGAGGVAAAICVTAEVGCAAVAEGGATVAVAGGAVLVAVAATVGVDVAAAVGVDVAVAVRVGAMVGTAVGACRSGPVGEPSPGPGRNPPSIKVVTQHGGSSANAGVDPTRPTPRAVVTAATTSGIIVLFK